MSWSRLVPTSLWDIVATSIQLQRQSPPHTLKQDCAPSTCIGTLEPSTFHKVSLMRVVLDLTKMKALTGVYQQHIGWVFGATIMTAATPSSPQSMTGNIVEV